MSLWHRINEAEIEMVPLHKIEVGHRLRESKNVIKDIGPLKKSIEELGVIHPILVDQDLNLVSGARRLKAVERIGRTTIPARSVEMTIEERQACELDENECRSDLDQFEASELRQREIADLYQAEIEKWQRDQALIGKSVGANEISPKVAKRLKNRAEKASGIPEGTIRSDRTVMRAVKNYPFLKAWGTLRAIRETAHDLDDLGTVARKDLTAVLTAMTEIDLRSAKESAGKIIDQYKDIDRAVYAKIVKRAKSKDREEKQRAVTDALRVPPISDARLLHLKMAISELTEAQKIKKGDDVHGWIIDARKASEEALRLLQVGYRAALKEFHASIRERE
jgi:ParB family chromosome partitioning protein